MVSEEKNENSSNEDSTIVINLDMNFLEKFLTPLLPEEYIGKENNVRRVTMSENLKEYINNLAKEIFQKTQKFPEDLSELDELEDLSQFEDMSEFEGLFDFDDLSGFDESLAQNFWGGGKSSCSPHDPCSPKDHCSPFPIGLLKCFILTCIKLKIILCLLKNKKFGLKEIKKEVAHIEDAVFSPTFGLEEIKSEVSLIETIVGGIMDEITSPTFGLTEIKAEVSHIESAVFSPTFGLEEIKSEVSQLLFDFEQFIGTRGPAQNLTTGPFLQTLGENNIELKAFNATGTFQDTVFRIRDVDDCPPSPIATVTFANITPCCAAFTNIDIAGPGRNIIVNAHTSSTFGIFLYTATTSADQTSKFTELFTGDFLPLGTFCV